LEYETDFTQSEWDIYEDPKLKNCLQNFGTDHITASPELQNP